jgi:hypothetical protein
VPAHAGVCQRSGFRRVGEVKDGSHWSNSLEALGPTLLRPCRSPS